MSTWLHFRGEGVHCRHADVPVRRGGVPCLVGRVDGQDAVFRQTVKVPASTVHFFPSTARSSGTRACMVLPPSTCKASPLPSSIGVGKVRPLPMYLLCMR